MRAVVSWMPRECRLYLIPLHAQFTASSVPSPDTLMNLRGDDAEKLIYLLYLSYRFYSLSLLATGVVELIFTNERREYSGCRVLLESTGELSCTRYSPTHCIRLLPTSSTILYLLTKSMFSGARNSILNIAVLMIFGRK